MFQPEGARTGIGLADFLWGRGLLENSASDSVRVESSALAAAAGPAPSFRTSHCKSHPMNILDEHDDDFLKGLPPLAEWCPNHDGARQKLSVAATMPRSTFLSGSAQVAMDMYGNLSPWALSVPPALERCISRPAVNCTAEALQPASIPPVCSVGWAASAPSLPAGQHGPNLDFTPEQWAAPPQAQAPQAEQFHPSDGTDGPMAAAGNLPWPWGQDPEPCPEQASHGHVVTTGLVPGGPGPLSNGAAMAAPRPAITGSIQQRMQPHHGPQQPPQQPLQRPQPQRLLQQQQQQARLPHQQRQHYTHQQWQVMPQGNPSAQQGPPAQYLQPQLHPNVQQCPPARQQQQQQQQQEAPPPAQQYSQLQQHPPPMQHYPNAKLCPPGQRQSGQQCPQHGPQPYSQQCPQHGPQPYSQQCPQHGSQPYAQQCPQHGPQPYAQPYSQQCPQHGSQPYSQQCPQQYVRQWPDGYAHQYSEQCVQLCPRIHVQQCPQQHPQQQQHTVPQNQDQQQWHGPLGSLDTCFMSGQVVPEEEMLMAEILAAPWPSSKMSYDATTAAYAAAAALANTRLMPTISQPIRACGVTDLAPEPTTGCLSFSMHGSYGCVPTAGETMVASSAPATPMLSPPSPPEHCTTCRRLQAPGGMAEERPCGETDPSPLPAATSAPCPVRSMPQALEPELAPAILHSGPATFLQPLPFKDPRVTALQPHPQVMTLVDFNSQLRDEDVKAAIRAVVMPPDVTATAAVGQNNSSGMGRVIATPASAAAAVAAEGPGAPAVRYDDRVHTLQPRDSSRCHAGGSISGDRDADGNAGTAVVVSGGGGFGGSPAATVAATVAANVNGNANANASAANAIVTESHQNCAHRAVGGHRCGANRITLEILRSMFDFPVQEVVRALGISATDLKRRCRALGIQRWPQRKLMSLRRLAEAVETDREISEEERKAMLERVARNRAEILSDPDVELEACLKPVRQAHYKRNFVDRRSIPRS